MDGEGSDVEIIYRRPGRWVCGVLRNTYMRGVNVNAGMRWRSDSDGREGRENERENDGNYGCGYYLAITCRDHRPWV
jgi:hypothetical protein